MDLSQSVSHLPDQSDLVLPADLSRSPQDIPSTSLKPKRKRKKVDPHKPKRARSAFMYFSLSARPDIRSEYPEASFGEIGRILGERWRNTLEEMKTPFYELAAQDKARFNGEMAKLPKKPKKPQSAFMLFSSDHRDKVKMDHPEASFTDTGRLLGAMWRNLSAEAKAEYTAKAAEDKQRYLKALELFREEYPEFT